MVWTDMAAIGPNGSVVNSQYLKTMYVAYRQFDEKDLFTRTYPLSEFAPQLAERLPGRRFLVGDIFSPMITGNLVHTSTVLLTRERLKQVVGFNEGAQGLRRGLRLPSTDVPRRSGRLR